MFFLIYLLVFVVLIGISWTSLAKQPIGITNVIPAIWESAKKTLDLEHGNGLSIIAMAFLLYALLQSESVQALFASKRKWLQKRKLAAVAIITITTSLLASNLWWADEFIHFYPLMIPFLLSMGFDTFSSLLCLYGGSAVGIIGSMSNQGRRYSFNNFVNPEVKTHFTGSEGRYFSVMVWLILTTILVFFNVWYCNKVQKKPSSLPANNQVQPAAKVPPFNWRRKLILFLSFFFILVSILGSVSWFAEKTGKMTDNVSEKICNKEIKEGYNYLGKVKVTDDTSPKKEGEKNKNEMDIAEKTTKKTSAWRKFGKWRHPQIVYWFTIGGIIICLIAKLNIFNTLITTITKTAPIIIVYIFSYTAVVLVNKMELKIKPTFLPHSRFWVFPLIFTIIFILTFLSISVKNTLTKLMAPILKSLSTNTLAYSITVIHMARMVAEGVSPLNGNLQLSLAATNSSYKKYIKKTWVLWLIIIIVCLFLISILPFFIDRGSG